MLKLLAEFIGTFIFFSVILKHGQALPISIALAAVIYFGGDISGGHFNPGVSFMKLLQNQLTNIEFLQYASAQAAAAATAVYFAKLQTSSL